DPLSSGQFRRLVGCCQVFRQESSSRTSDAACRTGVPEFVKKVVSSQWLVVSEEKKGPEMSDLLTTYAPFREQLYSAVLADVLDALGHRHSCLPAHVRPLKQEWRVFGRAVTLCAAPVAAEPARP